MNIALPHCVARFARWRRLEDRKSFKGARPMGMEIIRAIRRKLPRPQFGLTALFLLITIVSILLAVWVSREHAYRERVSAVSVLKGGAEHYLIHVPPPWTAGDTAEVDYDAYTGGGGDPLASAEDLRREDQILGVRADWYTAVSDKEMSALSCFRTLRRLDLSRCEVTDVQLAQIAKLRLLEWLALDQTPVGDKGIANLGRMPSLRFLNLSRTKISDAAVEHLLCMRRLEVLFLGGTNVTDDGHCRLAAHTSIRTLTTGDYVTDAGLVCLSRMPSLDCVSYYGVKGVTSAGVARLKKLRPDLTGLWGEPLWDPSDEDDGRKPKRKRQLDDVLK